MIFLKSSSGSPMVGQAIPAINRPIWVRFEGDL